MIVGLMEKRLRVAIVVLGDIGCSNRMQYHALSLATQAQFEVDIVANGGRKPHMDVINNKYIHIHKMASVHLRGLSKISRSLALLIKAAIQFFILVWFLRFKIPRPDVFLVQNPPSVPTLIAVKLSNWLWLGRCGIVIDWHNIEYTLLGNSFGRSHIIVKLYKWLEKYFGKTADGSLCVSEMMQRWLLLNWGVKASLSYDKPFEFFHSVPLKESHKLFCSLDACDRDGFHDWLSTGKKSLNDPSHTLFSTRNGDNVSLKSNRPALVVSSINWTSYVEIIFLLEAADMYDRLVAEALNEDDSIDKEKLWIDLSNGEKNLYPRLLFIIIGEEGPYKKKFEEGIKKLKLRRVAFQTMWLSAEEYPLLLGSADLGVSLHSCSSGLELPTKVVEMFEFGLPVCTIFSLCIIELVKHRKNGLRFFSSSELADQLMMLFKGFPDNCDALKALQDGALSKSLSSRWHTEWETHALPVIQEVISKKRKMKDKPF